jgi:hypothetical protein
MAHRLVPSLFGLTVATSSLFGCGGGASGTGGQGGTASSATGATTGATGTASTSATSSSTGTGAGGGTVAIDLCQGLVADKTAHPMSAAAKPALGVPFTDPEFGTKIIRITDVPASGNDPAIKPMYSPAAAWNADESKLLLYHVDVGHELYDGKTYAFLQALDINPADIEQVWWDGKDPDLFYYVDGKVFTRYHVSTGAKDAMHTFSFCTGGAAADSHAYTSWSSNAVGLACDGTSFVYHLDSDQVTGQTASAKTPPHMAASGTLTYWEGDVTDLNLTTLRTLDLANPDEHSCLGLLPNGHDVYDSSIYDPGPMGSEVGALVAFDLTDGSWRTIIGPSTGFPYPPDAIHISAIATKNPGWAWVSVVGNTSGAGVLDQELAIADVTTGKVCRAAHHRSFGKNNTHLATPYFAEPHVTTSRTGTRAVFGSDWGDGATVDTYVVELPTYVP